MAVPKRKTSRSDDPRRASRRTWRLAPPRALAVPELRRVEAAAHGVRQLRLVPRPPGPRRRVTDRRRRDRDRAPTRDRGRRDGRRPRARRDRRGRRSRRRPSSTSTSCSSGSPTRSRAHLPGGAAPDGRRGPRRAPRSSRWTTSPRAAVRTKKDSSLVRGAEAVRDGRAARDGRRRQHRRDDGRRAAALRPDPGRAPARDRGADPGARRRPPQLLVDGGATVDPQPEWLVAVGRARPRRTPGSASASTSRRSGCSRTARSRARATTLRKQAFAAARRRCRASSATSRAATSCAARADVIVTDGFTGNVALKTRRRRAARARRARVRRARLDAGGRRRRPTSSTPLLLEAARRCSTPTTPAARCCSASNGVCVISHGSSSATRDRQRGRASRATASTAGVVDR